MFIGICGYINSGKGTVGDILELKGFIKDSFAAPLKDAISVIFGWDRKMLEGDTKESREWREQADPYWSERFGYDFSPRLALQLMGSEAGRDVFHKDLWIISLLYRNQKNLQEGKNIIVTDCRFRNEITAIHNAGGIIVRVKRGEEPEWYLTAMRANEGNAEAEYRMEKEYKIHRSEWDWIGAHMDCTIINNGTLEELHQNVERMLYIIETTENM